MKIQETNISFQSIMSASNQGAANEQAIREGGGLEINIQPADAVLNGNGGPDGSHPSSVLGGISAVPSSVSKNLLNPPPTSMAAQLASNKAMPSFGFHNPFAGSEGPASINSPMVAIASSDATSTPRQSTPPSDGSGSDVRLVAQHSIPTNFSSMTAEQIIAYFEQSKILNVPRQTWIEHDLSGIAPSLLNEYLLNEIGIKIPLKRDRIITCITKLVVADASLTPALQRAWMRRTPPKRRKYTTSCSLLLGHHHSSSRHQQLWRRSPSASAILATAALLPDIPVNFFLKAKKGGHLLFCLKSLKGQTFLSMPLQGRLSVSGYSAAGLNSDATQQFLLLLRLDIHTRTFFLFFNFDMIRHSAESREEP